MLKFKKIFFVIPIVFSIDIEEISPLDGDIV